MCEFVPQIFDDGLKLEDSFLEQFFFWLSILGLFLFFLDQLMNLTAKLLLNLSDPSFVLNFHLVQHLLIHDDLLSQWLFDSIPLFFNLLDSIFEETIQGFEFPELIRLPLVLLQSSHFTIQDVVGQFTWSEAKVSVCSFSIFLRRNPLQSLWRFVSLT